MARSTAISLTASPIKENGRHRALDSWLIFLTATALFTIGLPPEFIGLQARFGLFAQEMFRNGPSWFPTTYGQPYPDYPGTSTFLIYLVSLPFGKVSPITAILPTAMASALTLVVTYRIGALRSRRWGVAAVLMSLLTIQFVFESRSISLDQYTNLAACVSFYLVYSSDILGRYGRLGFLIPVWIISFACRGPIGLVLPAVVVGGYYLWMGRWKSFLITTFAAMIALAICIFGLLAAARAQGGESFIKTVLNLQMVGRMFGPGHGIFFYWIECIPAYAMAYPLAILVVASRFRKIIRKTNENDKFLAFLTVWILVVSALLSIPTAKNLRYIIPITPASSLIASYFLVRSTPRGRLSGFRRGFLDFCAMLPLYTAVGVLGLYFYSRYWNPSWKAPYLITFGFLVLLVIAARQCRGLWTVRWVHDLVMPAFAAVAIASVFVGIADPIRYNHEKTRPFTAQVEALQEKNPGMVVFYKIDHDAEAIKFMVNYPKPLQPRFVDSFDGLQKIQGPLCVIMKKSLYHALSAEQHKRLILHGNGKIGHAECVILIPQFTPDEYPDSIHPDLTFRPPSN